MLDSETLKKMREIDINTIDPDTVVDAEDIHIDINLPKSERMAEYLRQIKNPYFMKVGKVIVKMNFNDGGPSLEECLVRYLRLC
jgi:hypothetical protein